MYRNRQGPCTSSKTAPHVSLQCRAVHNPCLSSGLTKINLRRRCLAATPHGALNYPTAGSLQHKLPAKPWHKPCVLTAASSAASGSDSSGHEETSSSSSSSSRNSSSTGSNADADNNVTAGGLPGMLKKWNQDTRKLREQLQSLGLAGVVAYGLFNTAYYTVAFLFVWFTVANVPAGLGLQAAARKAAEVFALVWAGSQVTKLLRAAGALAFAPVVDKGLTWAVEKFRLRDKQQAFGLVVAACLTLAATVFGFVVAVHA